MRPNCISIAKSDEYINEDAAIARKGIIAISDGAGGGGVFAECWSQYLTSRLPAEPIIDYARLDSWIDGIWEEFYNSFEQEAIKVGGMFLDKFYDEGSFATLVAVWKLSEKECRWISYGDSVAFCYDRQRRTLQHSYTNLKDFNNPPYLINCKDPLDKQGFRTGTFETSDNSIVFAASDTLAHYILTLYAISKKMEDIWRKELDDAIAAKTKNSSLVASCLSMKKHDFEHELGKLARCIKNKHNFKQHLKKLRECGLIGYDDYSLAIM